MKIEFAHYGEKRDVNASDGELAIFNIVKSFLIEAGAASNSVVLFRRSDSYVTIKCRVEIARVKYTERARWVSFQIADSLRDKYVESDLFSAQKNKGQLFWKSSLSDVSDLVSDPAYQEIIVAAYKEGF